MKKTTILLSLAAVLLTAGCAKEQTKSDSAAAKLYFESWVQTYYPEAERAGYGIYILEDEPGEGEPLDVEATPFVLVDYTVTDLAGTIQSTTSEALSKRIGTYNAAYRYGSQYWMAEVSYLGIYAGVADLLSGMRLGGRRKAAIPYWLCTNDLYVKEETYLEKVTSGSNLIYEVTLHDAVEDISEYEGKLLDEYAKTYMDGVDSTHIAGDEKLGKFGFYFLSRGIAREQDLTYEMPSDTTMYLNYTGKCLDGKVFDTTIANVAKDAGIYNASRTYGPVRITRSEKYTDIQMNGSSELVDGFQAALYMLHPMEKATTAFYSGLGYSYSGSGMVIPPFTPLVFELELVEAPE